MRFLLILILVLSSYSSIEAQKPQFDWVATIGDTFAADDEGKAVATDSIGNLYVTGNFNGSFDADPDPFAAWNISGGLGTDIYIAKYDSLGSLVWAFSIAGTGDQSVSSICILPGGDFVVAGTTNASVDFDPSDTGISMAGSASGIFVARYSGSGALVWLKAGTTGLTAIYPTPPIVAVDSSGNIFLTGSFYNSVTFNNYPNTSIFLQSNGHYDIYLIRLSATGNYLWGKNIGGTTAEIAKGMIVEPGGMVVITGTFYGSTDMDPSTSTYTLTSQGGSDGFFARFDTSGNFSFAKSIKSSSDIICNAIQSGPNGNLTLVGSFRSSADFDPSSSTFTMTTNGQKQSFTATYDSVGNFLWAKQTLGNQDCEANSLDIDSSGNIFVTGYFQGLINFDPASSSYTLSSIGIGDIYLLKYDPTGNFIWALGVGDSLNSSGNSINIATDNSPVITGYFYGTADFDPTSGTSQFTSRGGKTSFISKYKNLTGSHDWSWALAEGNGGPEMLNRTGVDSAGNVYITGIFSGAPDFDPSPQSNIVNSAGNAGTYLAKYSASGTLVWVNTIGGWSLAVEPSGVSYLVGFFSDSVNVNPAGNPVWITPPYMPPFQTHNQYITKYDSSGTLIWVKHLWAYNPTNFNIRTLSGTPSGSIIVSGKVTGTVDFDHGNTGGEYYNLPSSFFLAKYNGSGTLLWVKFMSIPPSSTSAEVISDLKVDADENFYITGRYISAIDFDPGPGVQTFTNPNNSGIMLIKYNSSGAYIWGKSIHSHNAQVSAGGSIGNEMAISGNSIYLAGSVSTGLDLDPSQDTLLVPINSNPFLLEKFDTAGNMVWAKTIPVIGNASNVQPNSISLDGQESIYLTGQFSKVVDFDPSPQQALLMASLKDIFLAKYDSSGRFYWAERIGDNLIEYGTHITHDMDSHFVVGGGFMLRPDFDPSTNNSFHSALSNEDSFVTRFKSCSSISGNVSVTTCGPYTWPTNGITYMMTGIYTSVLTSSQGCDSLAQLSLNIVPLDTSVSWSGANLSAAPGMQDYQWIDCSSNMPLIGETNQSFQPSTNGNYAVIVSDGSCTDTSSCWPILTVGINETETPETIILFPNPASDIVEIGASGFQGDCELRLIDVNGKVIQTNKITAVKTGFRMNISLESIASGSYFFQLISDEKVIQKQFTVCH